MNRLENPKLAPMTEQHQPEPLAAFSFAVSVYLLLKITAVVEKIAKKSFPLGALPVHPIPLHRAVKMPSSLGTMAGSWSSRKVYKSPTQPLSAQGSRMFQTGAGDCATLSASGHGLLCCVDSGRTNPELLLQLCRHQTGGM